MWIKCNNNKRLININTGMSICVSQGYKSGKFKICFDSPPSGQLSSNAHYIIAEFDSEEEAIAFLQHYWICLINSHQAIGSSAEDVKEAIAPISDAIKGLFSK